MSAVQIPRYLGKDGYVQADRIEGMRDGELWLASGHRVPASEDLLKSGPSRVGDFWKRDADGAETLIAGGEFMPAYSIVPHALDVEEVSPDPQPGGAVDDMPSGSENMPAPAAPDALEAHHSGDMASDQMASHADMPAHDDKGAE